MRVTHVHSAYEHALIVRMNLNDKIQILVTDEEKQSFAARARACGMSLSAWIRQNCRAAAAMIYSGDRSQSN